MAHAPQLTSLVECANGATGCVRAGDDKAQPNDKLRSKERVWSDPIKPTGSLALSAQKAPTQLIVHTEAGDKRNVTDQAKLAGAQDPADYRLPTGRAEATPAEEPGLNVKNDRTTALIIRTVHAKADRVGRESPVREAVKPQKTRTEQARSEKSQVAKANNSAERPLAVLPRSVGLKDRSRGLLDDTPPPTSAAVRLAARFTESRSLRLSGDRPARVSVMQQRGFNFPDARRLDAKSQVALPVRSRSREGEAREPTTRLSSADSGGVMQWLKEPGGSY